VAVEVVVRLLVVVLVVVLVVHLLLFLAVVQGRRVARPQPKARLG
jgi:heme/copper-type cytochrome/quinol oxidase subunit 2